MNLDQLISLLGHSSVYPPLDDFLENVGIRKRPQGEDSLTFITDPTKAITLHFSARSTYIEDVPEGPRSEGLFVLRAIDVASQFRGPLPYGLDWQQSHVQVKEIFGPPLKERGDLVCTYFAVGQVIAVRFTTGGKAISSFVSSVKDRYDAKNLGI